MKEDIASVYDIELLIDNFYQRVSANPVIGYIFSDDEKVNLKKSLPVMVQFWENALFYTGGYKENPLMIIKQVNKYFPLTPAHFIEWNNLFLNSLDELFAGEKANLAKERAINISAAMQREILK